VDTSQENYTEIIHFFFSISNSLTIFVQNQYSYVQQTN
jgi:hypothetical protein